MKLSHAQKLKLKELAKAFGLELVILYGSQARGNVHPESDIDLAVRGRKLLTFKRKLRLATRFDSIMKGDCDLCDLRGASPLTLAAVAKDGLLLFESKPGNFSRFKLSAINQYLDFRPWFDSRRRKNAADLRGFEI